MHCIGLLLQVKLIDCRVIFLLQAKRQNSMIQNHPPNLDELLELEEVGGEEEEKRKLEKRQITPTVNLFKRRHSVAPQHPLNS